jgi:hypothetical protein
VDFKLNKKGGIMFGLVLAILIWFFGIFFLPLITDNITIFRTNFDCTNVSISDGSKMSCLATDVVVPYFLWLLASLVIGLILGGRR